MRERGETSQQQRYRHETITILLASILLAIALAGGLGLAPAAATDTAADTPAEQVTTVDVQDEQVSEQQAATDFSGDDPRFRCRSRGGRR
jgi:hypothetical protein